MNTTTRKGFIARAGTAIGGIWSFLAFGPANTATGHIIDCNYVSYTINSSTTCRVCWGNPSCTYTYVGCYSKNGIYFIRCDYTCTGGCYECTPPVCQARAGICNGGACHCDNVCL